MVKKIPFMHVDCNTLLVWMSGHAWDYVLVYVKTCVFFLTLRPVNRSKVIVLNTRRKKIPGLLHDMSPKDQHPQHAAAGLWREQQLRMPRFRVNFSRVWSGYKKWSFPLVHNPCLKFTISIQAPKKVSYGIKQRKPSQFRKSTFLNSATATNCASLFSSPFFSNIFFVFPSQMTSSGMAQGLSGLVMKAKNVLKWRKLC